MNWQVNSNVLIRTHSKELITKYLRTKRSSGTAKVTEIFGISRLAYNGWYRYLRGRWRKLEGNAEVVV